MKKISRHNRFLVFLSTLALALGFGATLNQKDIKPVSAAPITEGTTLYFKPSDGWLSEAYSAPVRFSAYFFAGGGVEAWADLAAEPGVNKIYKVVSPAGTFEKVIFVRMKTASSYNNWDNKINQTGNLEFDKTNNLFTLAEDAWDGATEHWSVYDPADHPLPATIPAGTKMHVTVTAAWYGEAHHLAGYFFRAGEDAWVSGTEVTPKVWKVVAPAPTVPTDEWDKFIFVATAGADNIFTDRINQTADLEWDGTSNHYDIATNAWGTYVPRTHINVSPLPEGIQRNKVRLWLDRGGHYDSVGYSYVLKVGASHFSPSGYEKALVFGTDGIYFPFFDLLIPSLTDAEVVIKVVDGDGYLVKEIATVTYAAGDNSKLWRVEYNSETEAFSVSRGALVGRIHNTFFAKVLEGYLTCDANTDNGYMAFGQVDANFIPRTTDGEGKEVWNVEGSLGGIMIKDYESEANYLTGERETEANTDAYAKYLRMRTLFLAGGGTLNGAPERLIPVVSSANNFIMLFSVMFGIGLLGFVILKKKKA